MKKLRFHILICIIFLSGPLFSQAPNWLWERNFGENAFSNDIVSVENGNTVITGHFYDNSLTLDSITLNLGSGNYNSDFFIAKFNSAGHIIWAKRAGGEGDEKGSTISSDLMGNIYVAGTFSSDSLVLEDTVLHNISSGGSFNYEDIFVIKYSSQGDLIWVHSYGGDCRDLVNDICLNNNGEVFLTGNFECSIAFGSDTLVGEHAGVSSFYLAKLDNTGNSLWAITAQGSWSGGTGVTVDKNGNCFVTGAYGDDTLQLGSFTLTNSTPFNGGDYFTAKLNSTGSVLWLKGFIGQYAEEGRSICADTSGNVYVTGYCQTPTVSIGGFVLSGGTVFIVKYNGNGDVIWAKNLSGTNYSEDLSSDLKMIDHNRLLLTGYYTSQTLSGDWFLLNNYHEGSNDSFIGVLDNNGMFLWMKDIKGYDGDYCMSASEDINGYIYVTGYSNSWPVYFDQDSLENNGTTMFVARLDNVASSENNISLISSVNIHPNPVQENLNISLNESDFANMECRIEIFSSSGQLVYEGFSKNKEVQINTEQFKQGLYFIQMTFDTKVLSGRFVKQ